MKGHIGQIVRVHTDVHSLFASWLGVVVEGEEATKIEAEHYMVFFDGQKLNPLSLNYIDSEWFRVDQLDFLSPEEEKEAMQHFSHYDLLMQGYSYSGLLSLGLLK